MQEAKQKNRIHVHLARYHTADRIFIQRHTIFARLSLLACFHVTDAQFFHISVLVA